MINRLISELVAYGMKEGLVVDEDKVYVTNRLLELFDVMEYIEEDVEPRKVSYILDDMIEYALANNILQDDTITMRDLFDSKIMGMVTPPPSIVRKEFSEKYRESPKEATDYFFNFSNAKNYIRKDRIEKVLC